MLSASAASIGRACASDRQQRLRMRGNKRIQRLLQERPTGAPPGIRFQVMSMPSKISFVALSPADRDEGLFCEPLRSAVPWPWLRLVLRLIPPISP